MCVEQFSSYFENNPGVYWLSLTALFDWSRKLAQKSQPVRSLCDSSRRLVPHSTNQVHAKTKTVIRAFSRTRGFLCLHFEFSLVPGDVSLCSNCRGGFFGVRSTTLNLKAPQDDKTHSQ